MRKIFLFTFFSFLSFLTKAQNTVVEYTKDFEFKEGIYLEFKNFIQNKPVLKSNLITDLNRDDIDFMHQLTSQKTIKYIDSAGVEQSVVPEKLWGYSKNNGVFIYYAQDFYRLSLIGTMCHFTASITQYVSGTGVGFGVGFGGMGMGSRTMVTKELKQFVLHTKTETIFDFTTENIEYLLQEDPELLSEFKALKKKEKRESTFLYLRKYNQRHPLYFPVN